MREEVCATPRCTEPPESSSPESSLCVACWALRVAASRPGVQKQLVVGAVKAASKDAHRAARVDLVVDAIGSIGWQALSVGEPGVRSKPVAHAVFAPRDDVSKDAAHALAAALAPVVRSPSGLTGYAAADFLVGCVEFADAADAGDSNKRKEHVRLAVAAYHAVAEAVAAAAEVEPGAMED